MYGPQMNLVYGSTGGYDDGEGAAARGPRAAGSCQSTDVGN
jgi:hypothetical protein